MGESNGGLPIQYTDHALARMAERSVSREEVHLAIAEPDGVQLGDDGETIAKKTFTRRIIEVAYLSLPDEIRVLTVMVSVRKRS